MGTLAVIAGLLLVPALPGYTAPIEASPTTTIAPAELTRGRWGILFVVIPSCPVCVEGVAWLGEAQRAFPDLDLLLVGPWRTEELEALSSEVRLPLLVDEGGRMGAGLGVQRAPSLVLLLDGRPHGRLDWPFTEAELVRGLEELAAAPREGPWQFLGSPVPLGEARMLPGDPVNLDELPRPLLVLFFNPDCPPCWDALPGLIKLREKILPVVVVLSSHALAGTNGERLRETGLKVVVDGRELARRLAVRVSPTFLIVDQEGVIRWVHEGAAELGELGRAVMAAWDEAGDGE